LNQTNKREWTEDEENLVLELHNDGRGWKVIAGCIGRTVAACQRRWHHLLSQRTQAAGGEIAKRSKVKLERNFIRDHISSETHETRKCSEAFKRATDLKRHRAFKHGVKRFDCLFRNYHRRGEKAFSRKDNRSQHLRAYHMQKILKRTADEEWGLGG
jgi:hypothetical protein